MKKWFIVGGLLIVALIAGWFLFGKDGLNSQNQSESESAIQTDNKTEGDETGTSVDNVSVETSQKTENKLCDWIDEFGIVIELDFAPGVVKESAYETGFSVSSTEFHARLAREACDYRSAMKPEEMAGKGAVQVGVRGYSDNQFRQLEGAPISVVFDAEGKPNVSLPIRVKVLN